jgi:hypothetical protein
MGREGRAQQPDRGQPGRQDRLRGDVGQIEQGDGHGGLHLLPRRFPEGSERTTA